MTAANGEMVGSVVDLYCGCGGFSLGAELAGFQSLAAVDIEPTLQSAYRRNFRGSFAIEANATDIDLAGWRQLLGKKRPDGLIGGPPCQGFSPIGRRRADDPRNTLIHDFYRHVNLLRPKFFVMENVEGLLSTANVDILKNAVEGISGRYRVLEPLVVNAADFGAATRRRRVVVIGYDPDEIDEISADSFIPKRLRRASTVRQAISDLPEPIDEDGEYGWAKYPARARKGLSTYARRMREGPPDRLGWREAVERFKAGFVSGLVTTRHSQEVALRYSAISGGKTDKITKSYRLEWDGQCPTLRAGTGADKGAFQAVRPLHPASGRVITVREAARLQGFPDWFVFHVTKWHSFRMIGNSVSPAVSLGIMARIAESLHASLAPRAPMSERNVHVR